ncbi:DUF305 domain-containing protein [Phenylobacterium sp.]|uniref:DUF305 domain-containing protein n=1 Tax=Phenylobacterium sp. TaxID=1871053 RepID=UPI00286E23B3|nr:DUF305 domain-containing protein [Phenylobacterium sp.]
MQRNLILIAASSAFALGAGSALAHPPAEMDHSKMKGMDHSKMEGMDHSKMESMDHGKMAMGSHMKMAMTGFMSSMKTMDHAMMAANGPTVDVTYARKMIAHRQGAIDMAKVELMHGSDPSAKRLAQMTIDENTKGIADLREYLRKNGG